MLAIRVLLTAAGVALLLWAYVILDNIWNYNDSGTLTYILYALMPALLGVLCIRCNLCAPGNQSRAASPS